MSAISCIDKNLQPVIALIGSGSFQFNPTAFQNPLATLNSQLASATLSTFTAVETARAFYSPSDPNYIHLTSLMTSLTSLYTATPSPAGSIFEFQSWSNFQSGQLSVFPSAALSSITGAVANLNLVTNINFPGMMSVSLGGKAAQDALCLLSPPGTCNPVNNVFASISGGFNATLNSILSGLNAMTDFIMNYAAYITSITGWITSVTNQILSDVNALIASILNVIQYGLAKTLVSFLKDPCMTSIINLVGTPQLIIALNNV